MCVCVCVCEREREREREREIPGFLPTCMLEGGMEFIPQEYLVFCVGICSESEGCRKG